MEPRPPVPPFTEDTARAKVRAAEQAWNTRDPERVAAAYTADSQWRNRDEFLEGREEIVAFLRRKWAKELGYMRRREASIDDVPIAEHERRIRGPRADGDDSGIPLR